jgi:hypothetical protein
LRTPQKVNVNGLNQCGELRQELVYGLRRKSMNNLLLRAPKDIFAFEEERRSRQRLAVPLVDMPSTDDGMTAI